MSIFKIFPPKVITNSSSEQEITDYYIGVARKCLYQAKKHTKPKTKMQKRIEKAITTINKI